jgi:hypothetical protein
MDHEPWSMVQDRITERKGATQQIKHEFCLTYLMMTETEYLEALNKATNGAMVRDLWN